MVTRERSPTAAVTVSDKIFSLAFARSSANPGAGAHPSVDPPMLHSFSHTSTLARAAPYRQGRTAWTVGARSTLAADYPLTAIRGSDTTEWTTLSRWGGKL